MSNLLGFADPKMAQNAMNTLFGIFDESTQVQKLAASEQLTSMEMSNDQKLLLLEDQKNQYNLQKAVERDVIHNVRSDMIKTTDIMSTLEGRGDYGQMVRVYGEFINAYGLEQSAIDSMDAEIFNLDPKTKAAIGAKGQAAGWIRSRVPELRTQIKSWDSILSQKRFSVHQVFPDSNVGPNDQQEYSILDVIREAGSGDSESAKQALNFLVKNTDPGKKAGLANFLGAQYIQDPLHFGGEGTAMRVRRDANGRIDTEGSSVEYQSYIQRESEFKELINNREVDTRAEAHAFLEQEDAAYNLAFQRSNGKIGTKAEWRQANTRKASDEYEFVRYTGYVRANLTDRQARSKAYNDKQLWLHQSAGLINEDQYKDNVLNNPHTAQAPSEEESKHWAEVRKEKAELEILTKRGVAAFAPEDKLIGDITVASYVHKGMARNSGIQKAKATEAWSRYNAERTSESLKIAQDLDKNARFFSLASALYSDGKGEMRLVGQEFDVYFEPRSGGGGTGDFPPEAIFIPQSSPNQKMYDSRGREIKATLNTTETGLRGVPGTEAKGWWARPKTEEGRDAVETYIVGWHFANNVKITDESKNILLGRVESRMTKYGETGFEPNIQAAQKSYDQEIAKLESLDEEDARLAEKHSSFVTQQSEQPVWVQKMNIENQQRVNRMILSANIAAEAATVSDMRTKENIVLRGSLSSPSGSQSPSFVQGAIEKPTDPEQIIQDYMNRNNYSREEAIAEAQSLGDLPANGNF